MANTTITLAEAQPAFGPDGKGKTAEPGEYTLLDIDGSEREGLAYLTDEDGDWYCVQRLRLQLTNTEG